MGLFVFAPLTRPTWILADALQVVIILIVVEVIRSYAFMFGVKNTSSYTPWVRTLHKIINPVLAPFRALWEGLLNSLSRNYRMQTYAMRRIDLSPLLAMLAIQILQTLLLRAG